MMQESRPSGSNRNAASAADARPPAAAKLCELFELLFATLDAPPHELPGPPAQPRAHPRTLSPRCKNKTRRATQVRNRSA